MKARKVRGLDPAAPLRDNARRIVAVRLDELCSFAPRVLDPREVTALHDMRIAAKRLRYVLEVTGSCFGPYAADARRKARDLQDLLGEIHDCDVLGPRVLETMAEQRNAAVADVVRRARGAEDVEPALAADVRQADAWRGLEALLVHLHARREHLYARFLAFWTDLEREGFRSRLEDAIAERPADTPDPAPA